MKKALSTILVVGISFALGHLTQQAPVSAQQDPCEKEPRFYGADFNNDGKVCGSISDVIGFLRWCFRYGPPPQVCFEPELTELPQCRT